MKPSPPGRLRAALYDWECEQVAHRLDQDVGFYGLLAATLGGRVLELACGTARVSVALAERFPETRVVGLDIDGAMLLGAVARAARSPARDRVALVRADMRRCAFAPGRFDVVTIPYNGLQLLRDDGEAAACLAAAAAHLRPGGALALEVTLYGEAAGIDGNPGPCRVSGEPLGAGTVAGFSVELVGGFDHDPVAGLTVYHRRWALKRRGAKPMVLEDSVGLRSLDERALDELVSAAGLESWERERDGLSLRYTARRPADRAAGGVARGSRRPGRRLTRR